MRLAYWLITSFIRFSTPPNQRKEAHSSSLSLCSSHSVPQLPLSLSVEPSSFPSTWVPTTGVALRGGLRSEAQNAYLPSPEADVRNLPLASHSALVPPMRVIGMKKVSIRPEPLRGVWLGEVVFSARWAKVQVVRLTRSAGPFGFL